MTEAEAAPLARPPAAEKTPSKRKRCHDTLYEEMMDAYKRAARANAAAEAAHAGPALVASFVQFQAARLVSTQLEELKEVVYGETNEGDATRKSVETLATTILRASREGVAGLREEIARNSCRASEDMDRMIAAVESTEQTLQVGFEQKKDYAALHASTNDSVDGASDDEEWDE